MTGNTDFSKSEQYTLSIRLSTDGFSFSVFNPHNNAETLISDYPIDESLSLTANLKNAFNDTECLQHNYLRVNILMAGQRVTYMPLELFEDEQTEEIFYYNHPKQANETILYNILSNNNLVVLFSIDKSTKNFLTERFPNAKFYAQSTPLIDFFSTKSRLGNCRKLYAHLRKEGMELFAYERGRILLANSFPCKETADQVYYLLYIWKQLGFEQERDELHLTGKFLAKEALMQELQKYIKQVFIMNPATNLDFQAITSCE